MKLSNSRVYGFSLGLSDELAQRCIKEQRERLFAGLSERIEPNRFYSIRLSDRIEEHYMSGETVFTLYLEYEPAIEKQIVHVSPEEMCFKPSTTLRQKLKNCVAYLRDKTGGMMVEKEIEHNENQR